MSVKATVLCENSVFGHGGAIAEHSWSVWLKTPAGNFLFEQGFYVQSVVFPAVPYHAGVLRVQVNANHTPESVDRLVDAFADLKRHVPLPSPDAPRHAA